MAKVINFNYYKENNSISKVIVDDDITFTTNLYIRHMQQYNKVKNMRFCLFRRVILNVISELIEDDKVAITELCRSISY